MRANKKYDFFYNNSSFFFLIREKKCIYQKDIEIKSELNSLMKVMFCFAFRLEFIDFVLAVAGC